MTNAEMIKRLAQASKAVGGALSTDKTNTHDNYDYVSADKILTICGQALADAGVMVVPSIVAQRAVEVSYGNKSRWDAEVDFVMIVTDGEGSLEMPWIGRGADFRQPDKALYKAITSGHRYFLAKLLNVGVGNEDGEHEQPQERQAQPQRNGSGHKPAQPRPEFTMDDVQPIDPGNEPAPTDKQHKMLFAVGNDLYGDEWETKRADLVGWATGHRTTSASELTRKEMSKLLDALKQRQEEAKADKQKPRFEPAGPGEEDAQSIY